MKANKAVLFVVLLGLISLFSDMTYEAARSINGAFLQLLNTSATTVALVAGLGELLGYGLRFISGYIADRTKKYWTLVIFGYVLNLLSVPLMALAGYWQIAVVLMMAERIGKSIRTPARDALLSFGTQKIGRGWGYGLHEAMDQIGATVGPLLVSAVLFFQHKSYFWAYAMLAIPALIAIAILLYCRYLFPQPENLEIKVKSVDSKGYSRKYWIYIAAVVFIVAGYMDFPLIAFHFKSNALMGDAVIPVLYAIAMAADAVSALIFGKIYDKAGLKAMLIPVFIALFFAPMVFAHSFNWAVAGMILWGIGMGAQESIMKAEIAGLVPKEKRGTAFGTYYTFYGLFWFAGSALMGVLYDFSLTGLIVFSMGTQFIALLILAYLAMKKN